MANIVIWRADGTWSEGIDYAQRIEQMLTERGHTTEVVHHNDVVTHHTDADLIIATGGEVPVHETGGWMPTALSRMRNAIDQARDGGTPILGICLGSQMIAAAVAGPQIVVPRQRMNVGMQVLRVHGDDPVAAFHYHEIDPSFCSYDGVQLLDSSAANFVAEFAVHRRVRGVQYHPELSCDDMSKLVHDNVDMIETYGARSQDAMSSTAFRPWSGVQFDRLINEMLSL